ncbi:MAG: hypothetical protein JNM84_02660, partial [Planctomycetes bacterium]|nr:hypothetical protein [Planctomycetota bacterium]
MLCSSLVSTLARRIAACAILSSLYAAGLGQTPSISSAAAPLANGAWRAWLETPGGELPFALELAREGAAWRAAVENGTERLAVPEVELAQVEGAPVRLLLAFPHYDSRIDAEVSADGRSLAGTWRKRRGASEVQELRFHARAGAAPRFTADLLHAPPRDADPAELAREKRAAIERARGRFAVRFTSSADPAVALFEVDDDGTARGTFLTTTGDYRYLAGQLDRAFAGDDGLVGCDDDGEAHHFLRLSCFDGAHAFLFSAEVNADGTLAGGFWSGAQH